MFLLFGISNGEELSNASDKSDSIRVVSPADMTNLSDIIDAEVLDIQNATALNMISTTASDMAEAKSFEVTNDTVAGMADTILEKNASLSRAVSRLISIDNGCCKKIYLIVLLQKPDGLWVPSSYTFGPCEHSYLNDNNGRIRISNPTIYLYAASADGSTKWTGSYNKYIWGRIYPMRKLTLGVDKYGDFDQRLWGCSRDCRNPVQCKPGKACDCGYFSPD